MKIRIAAVALVALLALTGCAGTPSQEDAQVVATESEPAAPLVAETPAADESAASAEAAFLDYVRESLAANTTIPDATDDQLLAAGIEACDRLAAGETSDMISVIEGEQPNGLGYFEDSGWIVSGAGQFLCPAD